MKHRALILSITTLAATMGACSGSGSQNATAPTPTGTAPTLVSPGQGTLIGDLDQPITLVVQNHATSSDPGGIVYTVDVATDSAFHTIVDTVTVPEAGGDQTSVMLDTLPGGTTYYWRVRKSGNASVTTSTTGSFAVGPAITSGAYVFTIDGRGAACPAQVQQQFSIAGTLTRTGNSLDFERNSFGSRRDDWFSLTLVLSGHNLSYYNGGEFEVHTADNAYVVDIVMPLTGLGIVNPDGTINGVSPLGLDVAPYPSVTFAATGCQASFPWTLMPASN